MPLEVGSLLLGYTIGRRIGGGSFGEVFEATAPGQRVAVKFIPKEKIVQKWLDREVAAIQAVTARPHSGLVRMLEHRSVESPNGYAVVMPLANGSLRDELRGDQQPEMNRLVRWVGELAGGLDHLHALGFTHGDVTPANALLFSGAAVLSDFGFTREGVNTATAITVRNSSHYAPPEFADDTTYGPKSDQFSLAATYLHLRLGELPLERPFGPPKLATLPDAERAVLATAFAADPNDRYPTCGAFARALAAVVAPPAPPGEFSLPDVAERLSLVERSLASLAVAPDGWKNQPEDPDHGRQAWQWWWSKAKPWLPVAVAAAVAVLIGLVLASVVPKSPPPPPPTGFARDEDVAALREGMNARDREVFTLRGELAEIRAGFARDHELAALRKRVEMLRTGADYPKLYADAVAAYQRKDYTTASALLDVCPESERQFEYYLLRRWVGHPEENPDSPLHTFNDHSGAVRAVAFSPDGTRFATGGDDKSVRLWDAVRGVRLFVVTEHGGPVNAVAYHPDGRHIASGSGDNTVRVCDADNRQLPLETLTTDGLPVQCLAYDETGMVLAYSCPEPFVRVRNRALLVVGGGVLAANATYTVPRELIPQGNPNAYDPAKKYPFALRCDGRVIACTRATEELTLLVGGEAGTGYGPPTIGPAKTALAFSRDGDRLAVAYEWREENRQRQQSGVAVWSWGRQRPVDLNVTDLGDGEVKCVVFNPAGNRVITGHTDGAVRVWHSGTGSELLLLRSGDRDNKKEVMAVDVSPDGRKVVAGGADGKVLVWGTEAR